MKERIGDAVYDLIEWSREGNREAFIISLSIVSTVYLSSAASGGVRGPIVAGMMLWLAVYVGMVNYLDGLDCGESTAEAACYDFFLGEAGSRVASAVTMLDRDCSLACSPTDDEAPM